MAEVARIRTIKPEFWTDSKVCSLTPLAALLFIGLWNFADDCGHIEDEPFRLQLQILPTRQDVPVDTLLAELNEAKLIDRNQDTKIITIPNFQRHQKIDKRSTCRFGESRQSPPSSSEDSDEMAQEGKGMEGSNTRPSYTKEFEEFWKAYPARPNGSKGIKKLAFQEWKRLSVDDREDAFDAVAAYAQVQAGYTKDAERYLKHRIWEGLDAPPDPAESPPNVTGKFS